jgi:hypothetical protein
MAVVAHLDGGGVLGGIEGGARFLVLDDEVAVPASRSPPAGGLIGHPDFSVELAGYYLFMVETGQFFRPGELVPASGIYRCDVDEHEEHRFESTDVRGHRFPPLPGGCRGGHWVLERATAHR